MIPFDKLPKINSPEWLSLKDFDDEVWVPVCGLEGLYEVSNYGRVKSYPHYANQRISRIRKLPIILRSNDCHGYLSVMFTDKNKGIRKRFRINRLVAQAFLPNEFVFPYVNHKDENTHNNIVTNLEGCTQEYNVNYGGANERLSKRLMNRKDQSKEVFQFALNGTFINSFPSASEAGRFLSASVHDVLKSCYNVGSLAKGYVFSFSRYGYKEWLMSAIKTRKTMIPIVRISERGKIIEWYESIQRASDKNSLKRSFVKKVLRRKEFINGFFFMRINDPNFEYFIKQCINQ